MFVDFMFLWWACGSEEIGQGFLDVLLDPRHQFGVSHLGQRSVHAFKSARASLALRRS